MMVQGGLRGGVKILKDIDFLTNYRECNVLPKGNIIRISIVDLDLLSDTNREH